MPEKINQTTLKKALLVLIQTLAALLVMVIALSLVVSFGPAGSWKTNLLNAFPFPLILVNGQPVSAQDYFHRLDFAKKLGSTSSEQVYNKLVVDTKIAQLAKKKKVSVTQAEINEAYEQILSGTSTTSSLLKNLNEQEVKNNLITPELLKQHLNWWYNSQRDLNPGTYQKVDQAMQLVTAGQGFETVARNYSQDKLTAQLGGNFGFLETSSLLPEIREKISSAAAGDILLLPSRAGIQIVKVLAKDLSGAHGSPRVELQAVVFNTTGFETWLLQETKNISVRKIINNY